MHLTQVRVENFRNLQHVSFDPSEKFNFFFGKNGSGKSSVIEALHYLGYGRSFRTRHHENVIKQDHNAFSVFSSLLINQNSVKVGFERKKDEFTVKINGEKGSRITDLVSLIPVLIFSPQSNEILSGQPLVRRKMLDWGLFHVEQSYVTLSRKFQSTLKNRNALLKRINKGQAKPSELDFWDESFEGLSSEITEKRQAYCDILANHFNEIAEELLPNYQVSLEYSSGWDTSKILSQSLMERRKKDVLFGSTSIGPHKSELKVLLNGKYALETLSRGEQRMLIAGIIAAQNSCLNVRANKQSILLLDDLGAELDAQNKNRFLRFLSQIQLQTFITAIDQDDFSSYRSKQESKVFHVEHGHVTEE